MQKILPNVSIFAGIGFKTQSGVFIQKTKKPRVKLILTMLFLCFAMTYAAAQWSTNPAVNNAICTATLNQLYPKIVQDGSGGAIITWYDQRSGSSNKDIYAQRINSSGVVQWTTDGVAICTESNDQLNPTIVSDGSGGAIITWQDSRSGSNSDIYAQRINASGAVQWTSNGVAICTVSNDQVSPAIVSDGSGGAIITWRDFRSGSSNSNIYAQRINASGNIQWTTDGEEICTASNHQDYPAIASDGSGGAIITWHDDRSGTNTEDIYAQRINASGTVQWTTNGQVISAATNAQVYPSLVSDGSGGAVIAWEDYRSGNYNGDIYAQRVNSSGTVQWTTNGVAICTASDFQEFPALTSDGSGGAIISWIDYRSGSSYKIYAQRINTSGAVQWTTDGAPICLAANDKVKQSIASDGSGGAIISWQDYRSGGSDIYAQRINASGAAQWTTDGVAISTESNSQSSPTIVPVGSGGAIITWYDNRASGYLDIYAQNVDANGTLGSTCTATSCAISVTPSNATYTGGVNTNMYIGYPTNNPSATLATSGGAVTTWSPATYLSCTTCTSTVFSPTTAGTYTITGINCYDTCTVTICVKDIRVAGTSGTRTAVYLCHKEPITNSTKTLSVLLRGIPSHFQYHSGDKLGVCGNTCATNKRDFDFENLVIDEQSLEVMCSPNPFRQSFKLHYISNSDEEATVAIYGMTGNLVEKINLKGIADEAELGTNLPNGIYTVSFSQGDNNRVFRMIKVD